MEKQKDLLLIEADFNFGNKLSFSSIMIKQDTGNVLVHLEQHGLWDHN